MSVLQWLVLSGVLLLLCGLWMLWSWRRQGQQAVRPARSPVWAGADYADTTPIGPGRAAPEQGDDSDYGPESLMPYLDMPDNTRPMSTYSSQLSSLFPEEDEHDSASLPAQPLAPSRLAAPSAHRQLGKYVVEKEIGRGAMGAVYLGYDPAADRKVALKTMSLTQEFSGRDLADARARFLREAEMSGRMRHPDIVSIIDAGETDGLAYIAMELVEGIDLSQFTLPGRLLPVSQLLAIMARVAEALAYAHARGVTHRDIKPANIMIDQAKGLVKVMDFGVARVADATRTRTGVVLGTPTFMSPEQLSGQVIDGRSDLYSLGVSLFQLLTGQLPYRNDSMAALMRAIAREPVPNVCDIRPELPPVLGDIVALALEKHPHIRYATGHQMAEDLRTVAASLGAPDIPLS